VVPTNSPTPPISLKGHALVTECRERADRVVKISVIPRGAAALGCTQQQPTEDRYHMTRAELLDRLDVLLGGRVAEEWPSEMSRQAPRMTCSGRPTWRAIWSPAMG
jgi:cell division protease FtsH